MGDNFDDIEDLLIPHETLILGTKTFKLMGLGLAEIVHVVRSHFDALEPIYQASVAGKLGADIQEIAVRMAENFEPVATSIIACGLRTKSIDKVAQIPFPAQIEALEKIVMLTFTNQGGLEKTMEIVNRALAAALASQQSRLKP